MLFGFLYSILRGVENSRNLRRQKEKNNVENSKVYYFHERRRKKNFLAEMEEQEEQEKKIQWNIKNKKMKSSFEKTLNDLNII